MYAWYYDSGGITSTQSVCGLNNWAPTECDSSRRITAMAKQDAEVAIPTKRSCNNEDSSGK